MNRQILNTYIDFYYRILLADIIKRYFPIFINLHNYLFSSNIKHKESKIKIE